MFVVVHQKSGHTVGRPRETLGGARRSATCLNKRKGAGTHVAMSLADFRAQDELVEVRNLMSGNTVMLPKSQVGTCVDPSTERYWCM